MMSQQFQQPEPPNKVNMFMEKAGWQTITIVGHEEVNRIRIVPRYN